MRKVKVLFFAADPIRARPGGNPLEFGDEWREICKQVAKARYPDRLVFEHHGAARAHDLIDVLERTDARVMHFSGHGGGRGLRLVARDGQHRHMVNAATLREMFQAYRGPIRLAVLSSCSSHAEAQAIADVVGCAIGTTSRISDPAAITFSSRFYRAIASGRSVQRAFEEARLALQMDEIPPSEHPRIFRGKGVDPDELVLVKVRRPVRSRVVAAAVSCVVTAAVILTGILEPRVIPELSASDIACGAEWPAEGPVAATAATAGDLSGAAEDVADARAFFRARNYRAAASAFERAAGAGSGQAMGCLGYMYLNGVGVDSQSNVGIHWLRRAAREARDGHGMYALAMAYLDGKGPRHLADDWLRKAVEERGYAEAMRAMGELHRQEMDDSSYQQALTWYRRAVAAGSADARVDVGLMYERGLGVEPDPAAALQWYRSAAQAGSPRGMFAIGQSYERGTGVPLDYREAMTWYRQAARAGSADAMNSIGAMYDNGRGVRRSHARAIRWFERAARAGSPLAKGNLAALGRG